MWRDKMRLKRLKEMNKGKENLDSAKQRQSQEQARRKKMSRAQDGILKYMLKMMEVCKAQGFVCGIIPEKGKPVSGRPTISGSGGRIKADEESNFDVQEQKPNPMTLLNIVQQQSHAIKDEIINNNLDFSRKRKPGNELNMMMDRQIYTCEFPHCPHSEIRHGFHDRASRDNHQLSCPCKQSPDFRVSNFNMNEVKPVVFPQSFVQPKPAAMNPTPPTFDLSGLGVPEDGQRMINDLMSLR
ncbi:hypothetical protein DH2020_020972 [Rehmannia glutinosa]|uniref:Ethylene insensitive 3-like DNA-binding domain-containing protein n=1 Tax=Rehmannia glutinosa TaxID=99300 RepID=A0ABR0W924_REHGL